jgi:Protein of unknown function (DUF3800)
VGDLEKLSERCGGCLGERDQAQRQICRPGLARLHDLVAYRIYIDESGTHEESPWLLIGMLFAPNHAALHNALCAAKDREGYFNTSPKRSAKYREFHFKEVSSPRDVRVGKAWIDTFLGQACHFRALAFDWSMWDGRYFGDAFEPDTLKKRRAYKKWCELLLQPELSDPLDAVPIRGAELFLDHLRIAYGYDVIDHLRDRFSPPEHYQGSTPYLTRLEHTQSWRDANQCLQLTDLLLGALKQSFAPSGRPEKLELRDYLASQLASIGISKISPGFWKQYHPVSLRQKLPKLSTWCWQPERKRN